MIWFIEDVARFRHEREAIEALASRAGSGISYTLRIADGKVVADVDIQVGSRVFPAYLKYPNHFPHTPPIIVPRDGKRWSGHQYGDAGELCLEYGPDNWHPSITGAMMIESAERLLLLETETAGVAEAVPSRHTTTLGQDLRGVFSRVLVTVPLAQFLSSVPEGAHLPGKALLSYDKEAAVFTVKTLTAPNGSEWADRSVPDRLQDLVMELGVLVMRLPEGSPLPDASTGTELLKQLEAETSFEQAKIVLLARGAEFHAWRIYSDNDAVSVRTVMVPTESARIDADHQRLSDLTVGIVGCGSLGSKIANCLARCGVGNFFLVDDDVFLPGNLVRHDLDWRDVGMHKVAAVASRIRLANAAAKCQTRTHRLGGQEASGGIETLVEGVAKCDVLIDATADSRAFNYLAAAAIIGTKPLVWAQVFGGGYGGLIARSRPGAEPDPHSVKAHIEAWCRERNQPIERAQGYEGGTPQQPLIADDADVGVLATHAARLVIDTLLKREPSIFPHSVYFVGLAKGWIFEQPFETFPVELPSVDAWTQTQTPLDESAAREEVLRILQLVAKPGDASNSPADSG